MKIPRDLIVEEIHKYFGPIQNNNGYKNVFSEDPKLIAKVEGLWIVIHKKPYFLLPKYILGHAQRAHNGDEREEDKLGHVSNRRTKSNNNIRVLW